MPVIEIHPFDCYVRMDMGPLSIIPLPASEALSIGGTERLLERRVLCLGSSVLFGRILQNS